MNMVHASIGVKHSFPYTMIWQQMEDKLALKNSITLCDLVSFINFRQEKRRKMAYLAKTDIQSILHNEHLYIFQVFS